jgi:hypothetical protein
VSQVLSYAGKRDHFWIVPARVIFNRCSETARRNQCFNFQLFHELLTYSARRLKSGTEPALSRLSHDHC